jgi:DNA-binding NtrC family response regulator
MRLDAVHSPARTAAKKSGRPTSGDAPPAVSPSRAPGGVSVRVRPRILFVDDEPCVLKSLAATLRKQFEVISASSAAEALELLEREPGLRVVVSDYRMPGINGADFLAQARRRFPSTIRLLLSGAGAENVVLKDPQLIFRLLSKPCPRETLVLAIEDALAKWNVGVA